MPFLHAHRRRVPAQDIDRSVVVGMGAETAMLTDKGRLAFAALPVHGPAIRTGLRGIGGIDLAQVSAALFELVGKDGLEAEPTLVENAPVQSGLLPDHAARIVDGSFCGSGHILDAQVFKHDSSEALRDIQRGLVLPVTANAGAPSREFGGSAQCLGATDRSALATRCNSLCGTMASFDGFKRARHGQPLAIGQRQRVRNAAINADGWADVGRNNVLNLAGKRYVPTQSVQRHGGVLADTAHGPRIAEFHPADLWKAHGGISGVELFDFDFAALKAKAVVDVLAARCWIFSATGEEIAIRLVEIAQRLLLAGLRHGGDPIVLRSQHRQFTSLRHIVQLLPGPAQILPPEIAALLKREIVDQSTRASELPEQDFLFSIRSQLVSKTAKHRHYFNQASSQREVPVGRSRLHPRPKGQGFSRGSQ